MITSLLDYWLQKERGAKGPLFSSLDKPSFWQIGSIVELNSGHTKEFQWNEELKLNAHLMAAGFGDVETSNYLHDLALDESRLRFGGDI